MARIVSWWDKLQKILAQMEPSPSHSSPTMAKGQKNEVKVCANNIKLALLRLRNGTHWNQTLYP